MPDSTPSSNEPAPLESAPVVSYSDSHLIANEARARQLTMAFRFGIIATGFGLTLFMIWRAKPIASFTSPIAWLLSIAINSSAFGFGALIPTALGLAIAVWWREGRMVCVRYRSFFPAFTSGILAGAAQLFLPPFSYFGFATLLTASVMAGIFLTRPDARCETYNRALHKGHLLQIFAFATLALISITAGVISNILSRQACEDYTAHWLASAAMNRQPFYLASRDARDATRIFARVGIMPLPDPGKGEQAYPYVSINAAESESHFIIRVPYGFEVAPQTGGTGHFRFTCFFGFMIEVKYEHDGAGCPVVGSIINNADDILPDA